MKAQNLKDALKWKLPTKELELLPRSFDVVGKIAVYSDFPEELHRKEGTIAQTLLSVHKNIHTVAKKTGDHTGVYRTKRVTILAGEDTKLTTHTENGVKIIVDIEAAYFSPRLSNERLRVAEQVKEGEEVLVLFSGVGPYPLVIGKKGKAKKIIGVEKNPRAHKLAKENVILNKLDDKIELYRSDVRDMKLPIKKFDRILMPLPKDADQFLNVALKYANVGTIIHLYLFVEEKYFPQNLQDLVSKRSKRVKLVKTVQCGASSPSIIRICADLKVVK